MVGNPAEKPPYATLISSDPPYAVLSKIPFPNARGFEQPVWDPELKGGRMLATVPGMDGTSEVVVFNLKDPKEARARGDISDWAFAAPVWLWVHPSACSWVVGAESRFLLEWLGWESDHAPSRKRRVPMKSGTTPATIISTLQAASREIRRSVSSMRIPGRFSPLCRRGPVPTPLRPSGVTITFSFRSQFRPPASPMDTCNVMFGLPEKHGCIAVYGHEK